jgi:hypothetical protein
MVMPPRQGGYQRDMGRDYRQFAGGQPQQVPFQTQGYAPQGMQQTPPMGMMPQGGPQMQRPQGQMLARALQNMPQRVA